MALDRTDVAGMMAAERAKQDRIRHLEWMQMVQNQAKPMEILIGHPAWEPFANQLKAMQRMAQERANACATALVSPLLVDQNNLWTLKLEAAIERAKADLLTEILAWPRRLIDEAEKAQEAAHRTP